MTSKIKKTKKKKTKAIPKMTQKRLIEETNYNTWKILDKFEVLINDHVVTQKELVRLVMDLYGYADDLRIDAFKYLKFSSTINKSQLINRIGEIGQFHDRLELLEKLQRRDNESSAHTKETNKFTN